MLVLPPNLLVLMLPAAALALARGRRSTGRSGASIVDLRATDEGQQNRNFTLRLRGHGRWRRGLTPPSGFRAVPGRTVDALAPGECAEYLGSNEQWWTCCKSHSPNGEGVYHFSCFRLDPHGGGWGDPVWMRKHIGLAARNRGPAAGGGFATRGPHRNRGHHGHHGHHGGHPALLGWRTWPLAPWALPASTGAWSIEPAPTGCTIVSGKRAAELAPGECSIYEIDGVAQICVRDEDGQLRCMPRYTYLRQPAFYA
jgi:hypothetical protein